MADVVAASGIYLDIMLKSIHEFFRARADNNAVGFEFLSILRLDGYVRSFFGFVKPTSLVSIVNVICEVAQKRLTLSSSRPALALPLRKAEVSKHSN